MELIEKAQNYAAGKANEAITKAIAQAYKDGYHDGYNDCKEEIPVDLRDGKTQFIDLRLPSGTLWATTYEMCQDKCIYLPYKKAKELDIPTLEQWEELVTVCQWEYERKYTSYASILLQAKCIGPNGNVLRFYPEGMAKSDSISDPNSVYIWLKNEEDGVEKKCVLIHSIQHAVNNNITDIYSGFKVPIRLVRKP